MNDSLKKQYRKIMEPISLNEKQKQEILSGASAKAGLNDGLSKANSTEAYRLFNKKKFSQNRKEKQTRKGNPIMKPVLLGTLLTGALALILPLTSIDPSRSSTDQHRSESTAFKSETAASDIMSYAGGANNQKMGDLEEAAPMDAADQMASEEAIAEEEAASDFGIEDSADKDALALNDEAAEKANADEKANAGEQKKIYRANMSIQTLNFTDSANRIKNLVDEYSGFIQDDSEQKMDNDLHYGFYACKIPADKFDAFIEALKSSEDVQSSSVSMENITKAYSSNQNRIESLEATQKRLTELLEQAESVSDLASIETELADIRAELTNLHDYKSSMDLDLQYSTVYIDLNEVSVITRNSVSSWDEIGNALTNTWHYFVNGLGDVVLLLIYLLPWLLILLAIGLIVYFWKKHH